MEGTETVKECVRKALLKKENLRRAYDQVNAQANVLLLFSLQWKDLEEHFDCIERSLNDRFRTVEAREQATEERIREVERKEERIRSVMQKYDECEREVCMKKERLGFLQQQIECLERKMVEKDTLLISLRLESDRCRVELKSLTEAVTERQERLALKENELTSVLRRLELEIRSKEEKLGFLQQKIDSCSREMVEKEMSLDSLCCDSNRRRLEIKEEKNELSSIKQTISVYHERLSLKEKKLSSILQKLHESELEILGKEEKLRFLQERFDFYEREIRTKEERLGFLQLKLEERSGELSSVEISIKDCSKKLDSQKEELEALQIKIKERSGELSSIEISIQNCSKQLDSKKDELSLIQSSLYRKEEKLLSVKKSIDRYESEIGANAKELLSLQSSIKDSSIKLDDRTKELKLINESILGQTNVLESKSKQIMAINALIAEKSEALAAMKRQFEEQLKENEFKLQQEGRSAQTVAAISVPIGNSYPTGSAISSNGTQIKIEPPDFPTHQQYTAATNDQFAISDNLMSQMIQGELAHLNIDIDLAKLTLDEIDATYGQQLIREEKGFDAEAMKTHIKRFEQITTSSTPITPQVKQGAMNLAAKWVWKLRTRNSVDPLEVLGFFNFLAAYKLGSLFSQSEILRYIQMYSLRDKAPQLCQDILHSGYVITSPTDLLQLKGNKKRPSSSGLLGEQDTKKASTPSLKKSF